MQGHISQTKETYSPSVCQVATQDPPSCGLVIREGQPQIDRRAADLAKLPSDHALWPLILQCLEDNPSERPSCSEVMHLLLAVNCM